mgnify:FL=1
MGDQHKTHMVLVERYLALLAQTRPNLVAKKNPEGSLQLSHILWMLQIMKSPNFVPLTSNSAWISWIQASLYSHKLINIKHEKDITREILKQQQED